MYTSLHKLSQTFCLDVLRSSQESQILTVLKTRQVQRFSGRFQLELKGTYAITYLFGSKRHQRQHRYNKPIWPILLPPERLCRIYRDTRWGKRHG